MFFKSTKLPMSNVFFQGVGLIISNFKYLEFILKSIMQLVKKWPFKEMTLNNFKFP